MEMKSVGPRPTTLPRSESKERLTPGMQNVNELGALIEASPRRNPLVADPPKSWLNRHLNAVTVPEVALLADGTMAGSSGAYMLALGQGPSCLAAGATFLGSGALCCFGGVALVVNRYLNEPPV